MLVPHRFLGILREPVYSPGKVDDDSAILHAVAAGLAAHSAVRVIDGAQPLPEDPEADVVFTMAQGPAALEAMRRWQERGVRIINSPDAIKNCHRRYMIAALSRAAVPQPPSVFVRTAAPPALPGWIDAGAWIKRGDVHAIEASDVVYVAHGSEVPTALAAFQRRNITEVIIQRHVPGAVIKFYAVRGTFFVHFALHEQPTELAPVAVAALRVLAEQGAVALGLEIFGGDCVQQPNGDVLLIDLNDWPSYGRCRSEAAHAIASYVATPRG